MSCLARALLCALLAGVCFERASARQIVEPASVENFDVRLNADRAPAGYLQRVGADRTSSFLAAGAEQRAQGLARLQRDHGAINVAISPALGTPEVVTRASGLSRRTVGAEADAGFLTAPSKGDRAAALRSFLSGYADAYGLSATDMASLDLAADYTNPSGNMAWVELTQRINGVPVFQGAIRGAFTANGELVATSGVLANGVGALALRNVAAVTAPQALVLAAGSVGWDLDARELVEQTRDAAGRITFASVRGVQGMRAWPVYFPLTQGLLRFAWATELLGDPMGYLTLVDAEDGSLLFRKSLTEFQSQPATYVIYDDDSPAPWSPTTATPGSGAQAPAIGRTSVTLKGNEAPNTFNNEGWIPDHTNATDGNNVQSGVNLTSPNGIDAPTTGSGYRVFDFPYNPAPGSDAPTLLNYQNGEVTNVFYWANVFHDRVYRLGFTEAAGNFQKNTFGRGGAGGDPIIARVQHAWMNNNATFSSPPDGSPGHMQLSVFTGSDPDRSSGLDRGVILHELTHGLSNRLHRNSTGLSSNMARGMGEGWSDFYAHALVATANEDVDGVYAFGGWVTHRLAGQTDNYYYGIRRFPYAVRTSVGPNGRPHNPLTLADADHSQFDISDGAFPPSPNAGGNVDEVHNLGEIWAMALFEVRARFITRLGFDEGNRRILQFVTDAMKLDPLNPTFLQGRDSILAAAGAGGGTAVDIADIWAGFAARGMGVSAEILQPGRPSGSVLAALGANDTRVIEAFDEPGISGATATLVTESIANGRLDPGETVGVSLCVANNLSSASGPVSATLRAGGGVVSPSGAQSYGAIGGQGSACRTFMFKVDAGCGATVTASVLAVEQGGAPRTLTYALPVGSLVPSFSETFDGVTAPALPAGWSTSTPSGTANAWATSAAIADAGTNGVFVRNLESVSDLVSPPIALPAGANRLIFRHRYVTEWRVGGGLLEIAIGGGAFDDLVRAGGAFVRAGYSGQLQGEPIPGARAWSGFSPRYMTTIAELPASASGQSIRLRWRMASNGVIAEDNWSVDSVSIGQIACSQPTSPPPTVNPPPVQPPPVTSPPVVPGPPPPPEPGMAVPPPAGLYVTSIAGNIVTLRWTPPAQGPAPTNYVLEGGVLPGQVLASLPLGHVAPAFTFVAPAGAFYLRLHALSGANRSVASNEIRVFVSAPAPPSPPSNLTGLVNGNTITLAWRNTFEGGAPTSMALDVAGSINGSVPLGLSEGFSLPGVPAGTYTLAVRAVNSAGSSAASNAITLAFPGGCAGAPNPPANFLAYNIGHLVRVLWDAPASGAAPSTYLLHVAGAVAGSLPLTGDGVAAIVGAGTYHLSVQGMNACGASGATQTHTIIVP